MTETPWDPNPIDGKRVYDCCHCDSDGCMDCDGMGYFEEEVSYRPDRKIRCRVWLPHGVVSLLLWDAVELGNLRMHIVSDTKHLYPVRTWDGTLIEIRPRDVTAFERTDP